METTTLLFVAAAGFAVGFVVSIAVAVLLAFFCDRRRFPLAESEMERPGVDTLVVQTAHGFNDRTSGEVL